MDEEKKVTTTPEEEQVELSPEQKAAAKEISERLREAKEMFVRSVYQSIKYESLFASVGQPEKFDTFKAYVDQYEEETKRIRENTPEGEKPKIDPPKSWGTFLDPDKPITAGNMAIIWDQMISLMMRLSIDAAELITSTVYDNVTGPQFMNVQSIHEQFAGAIGELVRKMEKLEQKLGDEESKQTP